MESHSKNFLALFRQFASSLDYVLLDFLPSEVRKNHGHYHLDLLITPSAYNQIAEILSQAEGLSLIRTRSLKHHQEIELVFNDLSKLSVIIRTSLRFHGLAYVPVSSVLSGFRMTDGFKTPSLQFVFEYHLLRALENHSRFPSSYAEFFSSCSFEERSRVFSYIVPKYKFVINLLDDLYEYKSRNVRAVYSAINKNTSGRVFNLLNKAFFLFTGWVQSLIFGRWSYYYKTPPGNEASFSPTDFLMRGAYLKVG